MLWFGDLRREHSHCVPACLSRRHARIIDRFRVDHYDFGVGLLLDEVHVDDVVDDDVVLNDDRSHELRLLESVWMLIAKDDGDIQLRFEEVLGWNKDPVSLRRLLIGDVNILGETIPCWP